MPAFSATAPGKIILFGEHAVVYARPAIAIPIIQLQARAMIQPNPRGEPGVVHIQAPRINLDQQLVDLPTDHPIAAVISGVCDELGVKNIPACKLRITSNIPIEAGLGSGAAVSVAIIRVFSAFLGRPLPVERVSALAYEVEKIHHGTPSGIDNTVISYQLPIYFQREQPIELLETKGNFHFIIADTGIPSPTVATVGDVRKAWQSEPEKYEKIFDAVGELTTQARQALENADPTTLGGLMNDNQKWLEDIGVSSRALENLVKAARSAGSLGAKLSGGGRGGNMIALVESQKTDQVSEALLASGATATYHTSLSTGNT